MPVQWTISNAVRPVVGVARRIFDITDTSAAAAAAR